MKNTELYYDEAGDMLELCIGKPADAYFEEIQDGIFIRIDRKTKRVKGFMVFAFKKRVENNPNIKYDEEGDVLYVYIGKSTNCYHEDMGDDVFERRDEKTDEVRGFMILNFKKRAENKKNTNIKIQAEMQVVS